MKLRRNARPGGAGYLAFGMVGAVAVRCEAAVYCCILLGRQLRSYHDTAKFGVCDPVVGGFSFVGDAVLSFGARR